MALTAAAAPKSYSRFKDFSGTLIVVVPHKLNVLSPFKNKDDDGNEREQYQHHATVITLESKDQRDDDGNRIKFDAGESHFVFLGAAKVMRQLTEVNVPVVGRLMKDKPVAKGGKPWVLATPTEEDLELANSFDGIDGLIEEAIEKNKPQTATAARTAASESVEDETEDEEDAPRAPYKKD